MNIHPSVFLKTAAAIAALSWLVSGWCATEIRTVAQEATEPKFVPLHQNGKAGTDGLCIDIMRAIERVEPTLRFVGDQQWEPLVRAEAGVANGSLDAACGFLRNSQREARLVYVEPPLFTVNYHLVVRADDDVQVSSWDDVRKLGDQGVVLVINGFGMINRLQDIGGLKVDSGGRDSRVNLEKLIAGRGRFYIHRSPGIRTEITKYNFQGKVKLLPKVMHSEKFYMTVSKTLPQDVVDRMRNAITLLDNSGELKRLLEKWSGY